MALHGTIRVNGEAVVDWVAQRVADGIAGQPNTYLCSVVVDGQDLDEVAPFTVLHDYDDGALLLAMKVLREYRVREKEQAGE